MTLVISLFMVFYIFQIFYRIRKRKEEIKREGRMREKRIEIIQTKKTESKQ